MKQVLAVAPVRGHRERLRVFLDEGPTLVVTRLTAAERRLVEGRELDDDELREITAVDVGRMALDTALVFLSHRPRSEAEVRRRLRRERTPAAVADEVIGRLRQAGLLDDAAFAAFWAGNRELHAPRGKSLLRHELRQKGIETETAQEAVASVDEEAGAYRLAVRRAALLRKLEYPEFRQRLGNYLLRHGYPYSVAARTVRRVWDEARGPEDVVAEGDEERDDPFAATDAGAD